MIGRWTMVVAALAGLMVAAGGCVSAEEYNKAVSAARRANEELKMCQSALQKARVDNEKLRNDLGARDAALVAKDELIGKLKDGNAELDKALKELMQKYKDALDASKVRPLGTLHIPLPPKVDTALRALVKKNPDLMDYLPKYGMVKLKADLTFPKGSAVVKPEAEAVLKKLAEIVNRPEAQSFHIYAAGHTDDIPLRRPDTIKMHGSNWGLSLHRAGAVVKVLATAGVDQRRLGAVGFSKYHPIAPNKAGNKGNPLNRRVEIWILPPDRLLTTDVP